ncbi:MAG TPA: dynamin family protein [Acidimicrobiales bacterium]|nr:dynamin family protein [Acidimicrobiales bacterium]
MADEADNGAAEPGSARERALAAVDTAARVASALGRPDLGRELGLVRDRLRDPAFTVLVIGEFKQGKSSLVNALLGTSCCPVDDDIATAVPTVLRFSEQWAAAVHLAPESPEQPLTELRSEIPVDQVATYVTEAANPENVRQVRSVELGVPAPILAGGLELVDTPGVGGLAGAHAAITLNALPMADAVLFVSDAAQEYSGPELEFLASARRSCPNVVGVMTKTDFYPEWRTILDLDRGHLEAQGLDFPILPLSSELRRLAVARGDADLNQESGYPALERFLRDDVATDGERLVLGGVKGVTQRIVDELDAQYRAELEALTDPEARERRLAELTEAEQRAAAQRDDLAAWDVTLGDGIADLRTRATHDLDDRLRAFYEESDQAVDAIDPADSREELEQWLYRRAAEHLAANDDLLRRQVADLVGRVEEHFLAGGGDRGTSVELAIDVDPLHDALARTGEVRATERSDDRVGKGISVLRGSYSGVMMFGIMGRIVGLGLLSPVSLALGGLMTVRTVKDLRKHSLAQRRHTTKVDAQKYIGELALAARRDNGDRLERIRRQLRDHYRRRAKEHQEALRAALTTLKADAQRDDADRARRVADVEAELARLTKLRAVVDRAFA